MRTVGGEGGVPVVFDCRVGIRRNREVRVEEVEFAGAVTHAEREGRLGVTKRSEGAAVGQHEAQVAHLKVVVIFVEVDFGGDLGAGINTDREVLTLENVVERHRGGDGVPAHVDTVVEDA